jgi:hypothetical protein
MVGQQLLWVLIQELAHSDSVEVESALALSPVLPLQKFSPRRLQPLVVLALEELQTRYHLHRTNLYKNYQLYEAINSENSSLPP